MDPPLINDASFSPANPSSYTLTEIWPFSSINGDTNGGGGLGSGLRMGVLGGGLRDRDGLAEKSTVTEHTGCGGGGSGSGIKMGDSNLEDESSRMVSTTTSGNEMHGLNVKRMKTPVFRSGDANSQADVEATSASNKRSADQNSKPAEPPKDYIHVRARRGQATDSHSLAERARREKISERMKILQDLVPGCNKVIGKAFVLDEIINYIQSLQRQVEFLSMKLEAVNSHTGLSNMVESFHVKDLGVQPFDVTGMMFGSQATRNYAQGEEPNWLNMQTGRSFDRPT